MEPVLKKINHGVTEPNRDPDCKIGRFEDYFCFWFDESVMTFHYSHSVTRELFIEFLPLKVTFKTDGTFNIFCKEVFNYNYSWLKVANFWPERLRENFEQEFRRSYEHWLATKAIEETLK
jgi:hypothetical protein